VSRISTVQAEVVVPPLLFFLGSERGSDDC